MAAAQTKNHAPETATQRNREKYSVFLRRYQEIKGVSAKSSIAAMFILLEWEQMTICWQEEPHETFEDTVLRNEALCTVSRFNAFKKATKLFDRKEMERLGVEVVTFIAQQKAGIRQKLWKEALTYHREYGVEPTVQHLVKFVPPPDGDERPLTKAQLMAYVDVLKKALADAGIRPPSIKKVVES